MTKLPMLRHTQYFPGEDLAEAQRQAIRLGTTRSQVIRRLVTLGLRALAKKKGGGLSEWAS